MEYLIPNSKMSFGPKNAMPVGSSSALSIICSIDYHYSNILHMIYHITYNILPFKGFYEIKSFLVLDLVFYNTWMSANNM